MKWFDAVQGINTRRANILVVGDSIAEGAWATTYYESWIQTLRKYAQTYYQGSESGVGHIPAIRGFDGAGNSGFTSANGDQWVFSDPSTIDRSNSNKYGLGQRSISITETNTASFTFTGDRFEVFYAKNTSLGTLEIKLDGVSKTQINCAGTESSGNKYDSGLISAGTHTVEVSAKVGAIVLEGGTFYSGNYSKGPTLWDSTHTGASTSNFTTGLWTQSLIHIEPDVVFIALGTNDVNSGMTAANYKNNLKTIISSVGSATKILVKNPVPGYSPFTDIKERWQEYSDVLHEISQEVADCFVLDVGSVLPSGRDALGNLSPLYHNSNHPNSKGMKYYAASAINMLRNLGLPTTTIRSSRVVKYFDGTRWRDDTGGKVSVASFGAVGDGIANDVQPFRDAIAYIESKGGGTLMLESGKTYWIPDSIETCENLTVEGNKATIVKIKKTGHVRYAVFQSKKGQGLGYGAGANKNLTIRNITFKGNLSTNPDEQIDICAFAGHHHDNVLIDNCTFLEAHSAGHCLDLGGCSNVRVTNCQFIGMNPTTLNRAEAIQPDRSSNGSLSAPEIVGNYDGLSTKNLYVSGCSFLPLTKDGVDWPCSNPIGSHSRSETNWPENITFVNNYIEDPCENTSDFQKGIIRFIGVKGLTIEGNAFISKSARPNRVIMLEGSTQGTSGSADPNQANNPTSTLDTPVRAMDVVIANNVFSGFYGRDTASSDGIIGTTAPGTLHHTNIKIIGNTFKDSVNSVVDNNSAPPTISLYRVSNATVSNNTVDQSGNLAYLNASKGISFVSNTVNRCTTHTIYLTNCSQINISDLIVTETFRTPIVLAGTCNNVTIRGLKTFSAQGTIITGYLVYLNGTINQTIISDCSTDTPTSADAIVLAGTVTNGLVSNILAKTTGSIISAGGTNITTSNLVKY